jgi:hypothetical protein
MTRTASKRDGEVPHGTHGQSRTKWASPSRTVFLHYRFALSVRVIRKSCNKVRIDRGVCAGDTRDRIQIREVMLRCFSPAKFMAFRYSSFAPHW